METLTEYLNKFIMKELIQLCRNYGIPWRGSKAKVIQKIVDNEDTKTGHLLTLDNVRDMVENNRQYKYLTLCHGTWGSGIFNHYEYASDLTKLKSISKDGTRGCKMCEECMKNDDYYRDKECSYSIYENIFYTGA
jgi:hypothetical protein